MFLFVFLSYKITVSKMRTELPYWTTRFGFRSGGTFNISLKVNSDSEMLLSLLEVDKFSKFVKVTSTRSEICSNEEILAQKLSKIFKFSNISGIAAFNGSVTEDKTYVILAATCKGESNDFWFSAIFRNPENYLDTRWIPSIYLKPVSIVFYSIVTIVAAVNFCKNCKTQMQPHIFLFTSLATCFASSILSYIYIQSLKTHDEMFLLSIFEFSLDCIRQILVFVCFLYTAKGWGIVVEHLEWYDHFKTFIYSIIYTLLMHAVEYIGLQFILVLITLMLIASIYLLAHELIASISSTSMYIIGHLYVISAANIDPASTPIFSRYKRFATFKFTTVIYVGVMFVSVAADFVFTLDMWITDLISIATNLLAACLLLWVLWLEGGDLSYASLDGDRQRLLISDVEEININSDVLRRGEHKWIDGMKLPLQPCLVNEKSDSGSSSLRVEFSEPKEA